jgi:hypothetical protein
MLASLDPNLNNIVGLAWDCGAVTTGPVTVPLVLALGLGVSKMVGSSESGATGFGVVTLASLLPIISVLCLGISINVSVPPPMSETIFFKKDMRDQAKMLFKNSDDMTRYVLTEGSPEAQISYFEGDQAKMIHYIKELAASGQKRKAVFGDDFNAMERWAALRGTEEQQIAVFEGIKDIKKAIHKYTNEKKREIDLRDLCKRNLFAASKAIGLLIIPILIVFFLLIRETIPYPDEIALGIFFCVIGMALFSAGIELGLDRLGT